MPTFSTVTADGANMHSKMISEGDEASERYAPTEKLPTAKQEINARILSDDTNSVVACVEAKTMRVSSAN